ncbi:MAG: hypothetical protein N2035_03525 [Chthoniobacterales bacterium]|nr:hypothetical protein [Chthoniobacterales bacterium]
MTPAGWFVMILSVGSVTAIFLWCLWLVLKTPEEFKHVHGFEQEIPDQKE